jgi:hypothetical protein
MSLWRSPPAKRHDDVRISAIRVAFVVSLLVHALALWNYLPRVRVLTPSDAAQGETGSPLAVQIMPLRSPLGSMPSSPPPPEPLVALQSPARTASPTKAAAPRSSPPPVMTRPRQSPDVPALPTAPPQPAPAPPQPSGATDLAAYIEARRRARGESPSTAQESASNAPSTETENERQNRIIAANIGMNARPSFGKNPKNGGGVFQIKTMEYSYAEFYFFGWNKDISRNSKQVIEVRKGDNADIRIAVVRRMIGIIREHETEDFLWESHRLGRQLTLSARARDTAGLEAFMMQEFFFDTRNPP